VGIDAALTDGERLGASIPIALLLAVAAVFSGAAGATVSIVRDAPDPFGGSTEVYLPPEMAGFTTVLRTLIPLIISAIGAAMALGVESALENGLTDPLANAIRGAVAVVLLAVATAAWVRYRDRARAKMRAFMAEGRDYTQQQRKGTFR
jgi:hypothetical protein